MTYEISHILDEMPKGRVKKLKVDKYTELKELLSQIPEGKIAEVPMVRGAYRAFSRGIRAAGFQIGKAVDVQFKGDSAFIRWEPLTLERTPKRRGPRPKTVEDSRELDAAAAELEEQERREVVEELHTQLDVHEVDPSLIGDLEADIPPDVAVFQQEARRRQRR